MGESERNLALMFEKARAQALRAVLRRARCAGVRALEGEFGRKPQVVNEFLSQLDGFDSANDQVLILAATNMPWDVDPAMKRPGTFRTPGVRAPAGRGGAHSASFELKLEVCRTVCRLPRPSREHTEQFSGADIDGAGGARQGIRAHRVSRDRREREIPRKICCAPPANSSHRRSDWLRTARNLVKYAGGDDSYRDLERYLKANKLL